MVQTKTIQSVAQAGDAPRRVAAGAGRLLPPSEFYRRRYPNGRVVPLVAKRVARVPAGHGRAVRIVDEAHAGRLTVVDTKTRVDRVSGWERKRRLEAS